MGFTDYQQNKIDKLLSTDFKKVYELIPEHMKDNYYFKKFLLEMAEINSTVDIRRNSNNVDRNDSCNFKIFEEKNSIGTITECIVSDSMHYSSNKIVLTLYEDGLLHFLWTFSFKYNLKNINIPVEDNNIYELAMKLSEDNSKIYLEQTVFSNNDEPFKCYMSSLFNTDKNEICRISEAIDVNTNQVLFHEEFIPVEEDSIKKLKSIDINNLVNYSDIKELYVGKCITDNGIRYGLCHKPNCFDDDSYCLSFESVSSFGVSKLNLSYTLDFDKRPWLIEISEDLYNSLTTKSIDFDSVQLKKFIK